MDDSKNRVKRGGRQGIEWLLVGQKVEGVQVGKHRIFGPIGLAASSSAAAVWSPQRLIKEFKVDQTSESVISAIAFVTRHGGDGSGGGGGGGARPACCLHTGPSASRLVTTEHECDGWVDGWDMMLLLLVAVEL
jgi:hypothetical protein